MPAVTHFKSTLKVGDSWHKEHSSKKQNIKSHATTARLFFIEVV